MQSDSSPYGTPSTCRGNRVAPPALTSPPTRTLFSFAVCALLSGGPVWADCTAVPSGSVPDANGVLAPAAGDTVTCSGTSNVSVSNDSADNVTVSVSDTLTPAATQPTGVQGKGRGHGGDVERTAGRAARCR